MLTYLLIFFIFFPVSDVTLILLFTEEKVNKKIKRFNFVYVLLTGLRSDVINIIVMCVSAVWRICSLFIDSVRIM